MSEGKGLIYDGGQWRPWEDVIRERDEAQRAALELAERLNPTPAELSEMVRRWPWLLRFADGDPRRRGSDE